MTSAPEQVTSFLSNEMATVSQAAYAIVITAAESSYVDTSAVQEIHDLLELLGTGINCNTFSDSGRGQNVEVQRFKEAVSVQKHIEPFHRFCKDLLCHISSCIIDAGKSMDAVREKLYQRFHQKRIS